MTQPTTAPHINGLKICIVTDAWHPQVNGVVRTLETLRKELKKLGHKVLVLSPKMFKTLPCPTYPEIRLSMNSPFRLAALLKKFDPDAGRRAATAASMACPSRRPIIPPFQSILRHGLNYPLIGFILFSGAFTPHLPVFWWRPQRFGIY